MSGIPPGRRSALVRLGAAYARHLVRRRVRPGQSLTADEVREIYAPDRLAPLTSEERARLPSLSRCINCGLCALAAGRVAGLLPGDLATAYLRDYSLLPLAEDDLSPIGSDDGSGKEIEAALESAAAACPTGVSLPEVAAIVFRLSRP
jgi:hypothetical protein